MNELNDVAETNSEKRAYMSVRLGELEFDVSGAEGETLDDVGEEFDERIDKMVKHAETLQNSGSTNGTY